MKTTSKGMIAAHVMNNERTHASYPYVALQIDQVKLSEFGCFR